jgi:hypothetical protein
VVQNHPRRTSGGGREEARREEVEGVKRAWTEPGKKFSSKTREVSQEERRADGGKGEARREESLLTSEAPRASLAQFRPRGCQRHTLPSRCGVVWSRRRCPSLRMVGCKTKAPDICSEDQR